MDIDATRLRDDIESTAEFGAIREDGEGRGRTVLTGTEADRDARDHLVQGLQDAGLDVTIDGVGNILGVWYPDEATRGDPPVVTGSHLDSVPHGGIFDGPLGVYAGLEAIRAIQASTFTPDVPLGVVSFTEEEGSRFAPLLGSSVAAGIRRVDAAQAMTDGEGTTLEAALGEIGYVGDGIIDASAWDSWLEVHVEQGTRLVDAGVSAGVVTDITGIAHVDVEFHGESNHAGTTSMTTRADSLVAAAELIQAVESKALDLLAERPSVVGTVGRVDVTPNATNVIPGRTELGVDLRDVDRTTLDEMLAHLRTTAAEIAKRRGLEVRTSTRADIDPTPLSGYCIDAVHRAARETGFETIDLHSGAGHDTMHIAGGTRSGMIFAPSADGVSHSPREHTDWEDCAAATELLAAAIGYLARGAAP